MTPIIEQPMKRCRGPWPACGHADNTCTACPTYQANIQKHFQLPDVNPDHAPKLLEGEAVAWPPDDPRYEIDVTYEVWQGDCLVVGATDLAEARRYEALYQPCSLLLATTYRQPAHNPTASPPIEAGLREKVERLERLLKQRDRLAANSTKYWVRAAKAALAGNASELLTRIDMAEAPPVEAALSALQSEGVGG